jgi:hypothetical protein
MYYSPKRPATPPRVVGRTTRLTVGLRIALLAIMGNASPRLDTLRLFLEDGVSSSPSERRL